MPRESIKQALFSWADADAKPFTTRADVIAHNPACRACQNIRYAGGRAWRAQALGTFLVSGQARGTGTPAWKREQQQPRTFLPGSSFLQGQEHQLWKDSVC